MTTPSDGFSFEEPNVNTQIEQADKALHPEPESGIMGLIMKTRIKPELKPFIDHILSRAIQRGKFDILGNGSVNYNAAEGMIMADFLTSIAIDGQGREDLIEIVKEMPRAPRPGFMGNRGGGGTYQDSMG